MIKKLSKLLVFAVTVSACVVATIVPASADTMPEPSPSAIISGDGDFVVGYTGGITMTAGPFVALGPGKVFRKSGNSFELVTDANGRQAQQMTWKKRMGIAAAAVYPIRLDGDQFQYWLKTTFSTGGIFKDHAAIAECEIFDGYPPSGDGGEPTSSSPVECTVTQDGWTNFFDITVSLDTLAQASGTITPQGVDLSEGTFRTDSAYHHPGATALTSGQSTRFDAVLREGEKVFYENQARTEWAYRIIDHGETTGLWAAGVSTNFSGTFGYSADGRCAIYNGNPLRGSGRLDYTEAIEDPNYTCTATGASGNKEFDAAFTVGLK